MFKATQNGPPGEGHDTRCALPVPCRPPTPQKLFSAGEEGLVLTGTVVGITNNFRDCVPYILKLKHTKINGGLALSS